jgi:hypothetical protein
MSAQLSELSVRRRLGKASLRPGRFYVKAVACASVVNVPDINKMPLRFPGAVIDFPALYLKNRQPYKRTTLN